MTETREGTDVVERAAMAHCAMAVDLGLSVTPWDGLRQGDRVVARMCMEAATADMRAKLTRLRAENEALKEALRDLPLPPSPIPYPSDQKDGGGQ